MHVTRENNLRLEKSHVKYNVQKFNFSIRVVNTWNSLPNWVVSASTTNTFKARLDKFWHNQDIIYNFRAHCSEPEVVVSFRMKNVSKKLYRKVIR